MQFAILLKRLELAEVKTIILMRVVLTTDFTNQVNTNAVYGNENEHNSIIYDHPIINRNVYERSLTRYENKLFCETFSREIQYKVLNFWTLQFCFAFSELLHKVVSK